MLTRLRLALLDHAQQQAPPTNCTRGWVFRTCPLVLFLILCAIKSGTTQIDQRLRKSSKINQNRPKSPPTEQNLPKSSNIELFLLPKSTNINGNQPTRRKSNERRWRSAFSTKTKESKNIRMFCINEGAHIQTVAVPMEKQRRTKGTVKSSW